MQLLEVLRIAVGAALHAHLNQEESICVANLGDGSTGCGLVLINEFFVMGNIKTYGLNHIIKSTNVILFMNNFMLGWSNLGETMSWDRLSRIATGVN